MLGENVLRYNENVQSESLVPDKWTVIPDRLVLSPDSLILKVAVQIRVRRDKTSASGIRVFDWNQIVSELTKKVEFWKSKQKAPKIKHSKSRNISRNFIDVGSTL